MIFINTSFASTSILDLCKSQLKNKTPCEILSSKKLPTKKIKEWIQSLKNDELEAKKLLQGMIDLKKENTLKTNSLMETKKELDIANAQLIYRIDEIKGLRGQIDNVTLQLSHQTDENKKIKKNYDEISKKFERFSGEYYIQNRVTIALGIILVLALFLLFRKAKESFKARNEITVLRAKLKDLSIQVEETGEFPVPDSVIPSNQKENTIHSVPQ